MTAAAPLQFVALPQRDLHLVRQILRRHGITAAHQPIIFGSRATGRARRYSDLDLGFAGEAASQTQLRAVREGLEESRLPISVDVLNLGDASPRLRELALTDAVALETAVGVVG